ncbi:CshA/CshB family fibrillar adhesin-related protein [Pontixanthobacter sp.]|uniref:CshA/CshB family fibrillar adhesin-related protein n=1 Tax=Pontixanthobacter sp. TaxID=2792078 RepID=UPI003C7A090B
MNPSAIATDTVISRHARPDAREPLGFAEVQKTMRLLLATGAAVAATFGPCVAVQAQTTGTGTITYANSGNGVNKGSLALFDWEGSSLSDGIQNGDVVNFALPTCRAGRGSITATFSQMSDPGIGNNIRPRDLNNFSGNAVYQGYNGPRNGESLYSGTTGNVNFVITWAYTLDGVSRPLDLVFLDGEATGPGEAVGVVTNGGPWALIENINGSNYTTSGFGNLGFSLTKSFQPSHAPVVGSFGATRTHIYITTNGGIQAVALGIILPCDYSDGPASAGTPVHSFQQVPNTAGLGLVPAAGQFLIGPTIDADAGPRSGAGATGDDTFGPAADDEDGVVFTGLKTTQSKIIDVAVTEPVPGTGRMQAWVDWNGDGVFAAGERIASDLTDGSAQDASAALGVIGITANVPNTAMIGNRLVRLRFSSASGLDAVSAAPDGEVEDHIVAITQPQVNLVLTKTNTPGTNGEVDQPNDILTSGTSTTYTVTVTNSGPEAVTGAVVTDTPGTGLTCPAANPVTLAGDGVPAGTFTVGNLTSGGITLGTLENGDALTLTYSCEVD